MAPPDSGHETRSPKALLSTLTETNKNMDQAYIKQEYMEPDVRMEPDIAISSEMLELAELAGLTVENQPHDDDESIEDHDERPAMEQFFEIQPIEERSAMEQSIETRPIEEHPAMDHSVETQPIEEHPAMDHSVETQPIEERPAMELAEILPAKKSIGNTLTMASDGNPLVVEPVENSSELVDNPTKSVINPTEEESKQNQLTNLDATLQSSIKDEYGFLRCPLCNQKFDDLKAVTRHFVTDHMSDSSFWTQHLQVLTSDNDKVNTILNEFKELKSLAANIQKIKHDIQKRKSQLSEKKIDPAEVHPMETPRYVSQEELSSESKSPSSIDGTDHQDSDSQTSKTVHLGLPQEEPLNYVIKGCKDVGTKVQQSEKSPNQVIPLLTSEAKAVNQGLPQEEPLNYVIRGCNDIGTEVQKYDKSHKSDKSPNQVMLLPTSDANSTRLPLHGRELLVNSDSILQNQIWTRTSNSSTDYNGLAPSVIPSPYQMVTMVTTPNSSTERNGLAPSVIPSLCHMGSKSIIRPPSASPYQMVMPQTNQQCSAVTIRPINTSSRRHVMTPTTGKQYYGKPDIPSTSNIKNGLKSTTQIQENMKSLEKQKNIRSIKGAIYRANTHLLAQIPAIYKNGSRWIPMPYFDYEYTPNSLEIEFLLTVQSKNTSLCSYCGQDLHNDNIRQAAYHVTMHENTKPYVCKQSGNCQYQFKSDTFFSLLDHIVKDHFGQESSAPESNEASPSEMTTLTTSMASEHYQKNNPQLYTMLTSAPYQMNKSMPHVAISLRPFSQENKTMPLALISKPSNPASDQRNKTMPLVSISPKPSNSASGQNTNMPQAVISPSPTNLTPCQKNTTMPLATISPRPPNSALRQNTNIPQRTISPRPLNSASGQKTKTNMPQTSISPRPPNSALCQNTNIPQTAISPRPSNLMRCQKNKTMPQGPRPSALCLPTVRLPDKPMPRLLTRLLTTKSLIGGHTLHSSMGHLSNQSTNLLDIGQQVNITNQTLVHSPKTNHQTVETSSWMKSSQINLQGALQTMESTHYAVPAMGSAHNANSNPWVFHDRDIIGQVSSIKPYAKNTNVPMKGAEFNRTFTNQSQQDVWNASQGTKNGLENNNGATQTSPVTIPTLILTPSPVPAKSPVHGPPVYGPPPLRHCSQGPRYGQFNNNAPAISNSLLHGPYTNIANVASVDMSKRTNSSISNSILPDPYTNIATIGVGLSKRTNSSKSCAKYSLDNVVVVQEDYGTGNVSYVTIVDGEVDSTKWRKRKRSDPSDEISSKKICRNQNNFVSLVEENGCVTNAKLLDNEDVMDNHQECATVHVGSNNEAILQRNNSPTCIDLSKYVLILPDDKTANRTDIAYKAGYEAALSVMPPSKSVDGLVIDDKDSSTIQDGHLQCGNIGGVLPVTPSVELPKDQDQDEDALVIVEDEDSLINQDRHLQCGNIGGVLPVIPSIELPKDQDEDVIVIVEDENSSTNQDTQCGNIGEVLPVTSSVELPKDEDEDVLVIVEDKDSSTNQDRHLQYGNSGGVLPVITEVVSLNHEYVNKTGTRTNLPSSYLYNA